MTKQDWEALAKVYDHSAAQFEAMVDQAVAENDEGRALRFAEYAAAERTKAENLREYEA